MKLQADVSVHGALFSECDRYRYLLWRGWDAALPAVAFVGLNPSTATADKDDPTIRKAITLARGWGFGCFVMLNCFGWRSTDPNGLLGLEDPVGPLNDLAISWAAAHCGRVVLAWGRFPRLRHLLDPRTFVVRRLLREHARETGHLGLNGDRSPKHPLFLKGTTPFVRLELT